MLFFKKHFLICQHNDCRRKKYNDCLYALCLRRHSDFFLHRIHNAETAGSNLVASIGQKVWETLILQCFPCFLLFKICPVF